MEIVTASKSFLLEAAKSFFHFSFPFTPPQLLPLVHDPASSDLESSPNLGWQRWPCGIGSLLLLFFGTGLVLALAFEGSGVCDLKLHFQSCIALGSEVLWDGSIIEYGNPQTGVLYLLTGGGLSLHAVHPNGRL